MADLLPGSPKSLLSAALRQRLLDDDGKLALEIVERWIADARKGDSRAREQLLDRLEGKVEQSINATVTSRYVIEEVGIPYVDAPHTLTLAASDNTHYVALCAGEIAPAAMKAERESGAGGADPDSGILRGDPIPLLAPAPAQ